MRGCVCAGAEGLGFGFCPPKHILSVFSLLSFHGVGFLDLTWFCNPLVAPRDKCSNVSEGPSKLSGCEDVDKNHCNSFGKTHLSLFHTHLQIQVQGEFQVSAKVQKGEKEALLPRTSFVYRAW